jgi:hypothetical protein
MKETVEPVANAGATVSLIGNEPVSFRACLFNSHF